MQTKEKLMKMRIIIHLKANNFIEQTSGFPVRLDKKFIFARKQKDSVIFNGENWHTQMIISK